MSGLALFLVLAACGSAAAALIGLNRSEAGTGQSSQSPKGETAECTFGRRLLGAGGQIGPGAGQARLNDILPNGGLTQVALQGIEDANGFSGQWGATTFAICARPPAGLQRVATTSPSDSANKAVTATCPAGKRLVGTGAAVVGGGGGVLLQDIRPAQARVTVAAVESQGGVAGTWRLTAAAICASPLAGLERVSTTSAINSTNKPVTATCTPGKRVVATGAEIGGKGIGQVGLDAIVPSVALGTVTVQASEDEDGTAANWWVRAYAVCADVTELTSSFSAFNSIDKAEVAVCEDGMVPTGGGGEVTGGLGQVALEDVMPSSTSVLAEAREDGDGLVANWSLRAHAICASPVPGREVVTATSPSDSDATKGATAVCPGGKSVIGGGGSISNASGEAYLNAVLPSLDLSSVTAAGTEDDTGFAGSWSVGAYAVCAPPPPGLQRVEVTVGPVSDPVSSIATCPSDKYLLGSGAHIIGGFTHVMLDDVRPDSELTRILVTAMEDQTGFGSEWSLRAYAICANY